MLEKKLLSTRMIFIIAYSIFVVLGFILFFAIGFSTEKWFTAWLAFGLLSIIPNEYYMSHKAKIDNRRFTRTKIYNGKVVTEKPRFIQSVCIAIASICFGPAIIIGILIAVALGSTI